MADKGFKSKRDKEPRRSPRKRGKTCGRPFKAPRPVAETVDRDSAEVINRSSEDGKDIRQDTPPQTTLQPDIAGSDDDEDDVPIAATLPGKPQVSTQPKKRKVARVKNSWVYEPAISSASSYWDSSLSYARVLEKPDYCDTLAHEGNELVTGDDVRGTSTSGTEVLPSEDDDASSGSDESEAYVQPKKIPKPKRVKAKQQPKPKRNKDLSAHFLPLPGDTTVASEAFGKLSSPQKKMVAERVNKTTKKVNCVDPRPSCYFQLIIFLICLCIRLLVILFENRYSRLGTHLWLKRN